MVGFPHDGHRDWILKWFLAGLLLLSLGCNKSYDITIAKVTIPVPNAMTKTAAEPGEISFLGFTGGKETFVGKLSTQEIVEFYQAELPRQGWKPSVNLLSGDAMLAYGKENHSLFISVIQQNSQTELTLTVAGIRKFR